MTGMREVSLPEMTDEQRRVHRAGEALHRDGASPAGALELLAAIVEDRTWERMSDRRGVSFAGRFRAFVEAKKPYGLGFDPDQLPKVLSLSHPHENVPKVAHRMAEMREAVRSLLLAEVPMAGPPIHPGPGRGKKTDSATTGFADRGVDYIAARLKRDAPELADRVVTGKLSPNAAARQMGWRKPRIVVSTPDRVAAALRRTMAPEDIARLVAILSDAG